MSGRYIVSRHFTRWAVRDLGNYDADGPIFDHKWQAEAEAARKNDANAARFNPPPTLFDKDPAMTQPSIWDELDDGDFRRDDSGKPLIIPEGGGEPVPYRRCTSYISAVEDDYGIQQWKRNLAIDGILGDRHRLESRWLTADWHGKAALAQEAFVFAGGEVAANRGTRMHALTDVVDTTHHAAVHEWGQAGPPTDSEAADLRAYVDAVAPFTLVHAEVKTVHDDLKVAGTPDRVWEYQGRRYIGDLKTGAIDGRKCAMQTALYAHSRLYDVQTGARTDLDVDQARALIIHLPYGKATARVLWVDIVQGWHGVELCADVYAWRTVKALTSVFKPAAIDVAPDTLLHAIGLCNDPDALKTLWAENKSAWTDEHTAAAKARTQAIGQAAAA